MTIVGLKMVQNGLFTKNWFVELVELIELIKMCFSKSGLTHFQPTYDKEYVRMAKSGLKRPYLLDHYFFTVLFYGPELISSC